MSENKKLVFRLNDHGQGPELLRQVFLERGWQEYDEDEQDENDWNLWWRSSRFRNSDYEQVMPWQRLNHYPKCTAITKKDSLARNLKRMKCVYGSSAYNFSPNAFNLPNDYTKFVAEYTKLKQKDPDRILYWICKPADLSRGRGIFIFRELSELQYDCNAVVQQYVTNPLLISGYKFDLRIYVMVPSFHPLLVYIYNEGLVRFSTEKYDLSKPNNMFSHLTNTSINKHSPSYTLDKERVGPGCKWTLTQLRSYLRQSNIDDQVLFARIINIVILTVIMQAHQAPQCNNCFEVYGFDIIIDENLKPWLLEVNFSPSLSSDCQVDILVKKPMVHDLLDMLKYTEKDKDRGGVNHRHSHRRSVGVTLPVSLSHFDSSYKPHASTLAVNHRMNHGKLPEITHQRNSVNYNVNGRHKEKESSEEEMVPIIPGCGLPSVQQPPRSHVSSSSSARSSISSGTSGDRKSEERFKLSNHSHRTNMDTKKPGGGRFNPSQGKNKQKQHVNVSTLSDSAISSFSGSSDNSDPVESASHKKSDGMPPKYLGGYSRRTNEDLRRQMFLSPIGSTHTNISETDHSMSNASPSKQPANKKSKMQSPSLKKRSSSLGCLTGQPFSFQSLQATNRSSVGAASPVTSQRHNVPDYDRPWRVNKGVNPSHAKDKTPTGGTLQKYGDYYLVFPFNDMTRKCVNNGKLDAKVISQECLKLLKERVAEVEKDKKGKPTGSFTSKVSDVPILWGTLNEDGVS